MAVGAARIFMSINSVEFGRQLEQMEKKTKQWKRSLRNTERQFFKTGRSLERTGKSMMKMITGPLVGLGAGLLALQKRTGDYADQLLDLEQISGLNTTALQEWRNVARIAGVDTDALANAASGLTRRMRGISEESGAAFRAADRLGISFKDANGELRDTDEIMSEAIARLSDMEPSLERASLAGDLFGRRWEQIAPILGMTSDEISRARDEAHELGSVLDRDALKAADDFRKELSRLSTQVSNIGKRLAIDLMPVIKDNVLPVIQQLINRVSEVAQNFGRLDQETQKNIIRYSLMAAAIGPLVFGLGKVLIVVGNLIRAFRTLVLVKAPLLLKIAAITALITGLTIAGKNMVDNWEVHMLKFRYLWDTLVHNIMRGAVYVGNAMMTIGMLSEDGFDLLSRASADATMAMNRTRIQLAMAQEDASSFTDTAKGMWDELKNIGAQARQAALDLLGLNFQMNETEQAANRIKRVDLDMSRAITMPDIPRIEGAFRTVEEMVGRVQSRWATFRDKIIEHGVDVQQFLAGELSRAFLAFGESIGNSIYSVENEWRTGFERILSIVIDFANSVANVMAAIGAVMLFIPGMQGAGAGILAASAALRAATTVAQNRLQENANRRRNAAQSAPGMARGGVVPPGFPNDSYPAMLTSGERVIPDPLPLGDVSGMKELKIHITGELRGEGGAIVATIDDYIRGLR